MKLLPRDLWPTSYLQRTISLSLRLSAEDRTVIIVTWWIIITHWSTLASGLIESGGGQRKGETSVFFVAAVNALNSRRCSDIACGQVWLRPKSETKDLDQTLI